jgi:hypothetical protein
LNGIVSWLRLLEKAGFNPLFVHFVNAMQFTAASTVRLNDRVSKYFRNKRPVRQGCLVSSLLFIIAMDALSRMLQYELDVGTIERVELEPIREHALYSLYADDVALVVKADMGKNRI